MGDRGYRLIRLYQRTAGSAGAPSDFEFTTMRKETKAVTYYLPQLNEAVALGAILLKAAGQMQNAKGCILYIVGKTADNPDGIYVIEVWNSKEDHDNSLKLAGVRELISQAMPILDGRPDGTTLEILGGKGLSPTR
jgi:quinol monooxygenase YgiN